MAQVRWEDLEYDCLVNIIRRVGIVSLLLDVPFVCKSWHKASLDPSCWQHLDFTPFAENLPIPDKFYRENVSRFVNEYREKNFSIGGLVRLMVARGFGKSTSIVVPLGCSSEDLFHISEKCHELSLLSLEFIGSRQQRVFPTKLIGKWKHLEELSISYVIPTLVFKVVSEIKENCNKLYGFSICRSMITKRVALGIANHLPKIRELSLKHCSVEQELLEIIIKGCKDLEILDVDKCKYEARWDDKKLKDLGAHIKTFKLDALRAFDYNVDNIYIISYCNCFE